MLRLARRVFFRRATTEPAEGVAEVTDNIGDSPALTCRARRRSTIARMIFNAKAAAQAQAQYCRDKEVPQFAPIDGVCHSCGRNIYVPTVAGEGTETVSVSGIPVEQAGAQLITGCPYCSRSYCD